MNGSLVAAIGATALSAAAFGVSLPLVGADPRRLGAQRGRNRILHARRRGVHARGDAARPLFAGPRACAAAIAGACIAAALCFAGMHAFRSVAAWFALRMVMGVALTLVFVAAEAWILERAPPRRSGLILGVYAATLAGALALGGFVVGAVGHRGLTPLAIATFLAGAAVLPLLLPGDGLTAPKGAGARPAALLTRRAAAPIIMAAPLAMGAIETGAFNLLPLYARRLGFDDSVAALTVAAMGLGNLFMQPFVGWVGDRIGARATLMLCALSGAALPLAFPMASGSAGATLALLFVYSGLVTGLYTIGLLAVSRRFGGADLAAANAAFVLCYGAGQVAGPAAAGLSFSAGGPFGFTAALAAMAGLYLGSLVLARRAD